MPLKDPDTHESQYAFLDEASAHFFRAIKQHYTRDTAVDAIDALQEILGKAWKGRVIFNMMANNYTRISEISLLMNDPDAYRPTAATSGKIYTIKAIRHLSGLGLTEAKKLSEDAEVARTTFYVLKPSDAPGAAEVWDRKVQEEISMFRRWGWSVEYA